MTLYEELSQTYTKAASLIDKINVCNESLKKSRTPSIEAAMISHRKDLLNTRIKIMKLHDAVLQNEI